MIIVMKKIKENNEYVWYDFCTDVQTGTTLDAKGRTQIIYAQKNGVFKYNKLHDLKEKSMEIIKEKTDSSLLDNKRIFFACLQTMYGAKKNNSYPDSTEWFSC